MFEISTYHEEEYGWFAQVTLFGQLVRIFGPWGTAEDARIEARDKTVTAVRKLLEMTV